ncbi:MAG: hypothetical protein HW416_1537 [Chloroflexi bacterium]|nr:hypothetical protein [Chloroflexota bacterium]
MTALDRASWRPARDEELTWFRAGGVLPSRPRPLEYSCEIAALTWGLTQAFTISYWPLYELRSSLIDGQLYLGVAPSPHAEGDLENRKRLTTETPLRYTRNIRAAWERGGRREVEDYTERMAAFPPAGVDGEELGEAFFKLRRVRADQWCAPSRAVICPAVICTLGSGETPVDVAMEVAREARDLIGRGGAAFDAALNRAGERLAQAGCIDAAADVAWLEYSEVRAALELPSKYQATVRERQARAESIMAAPGAGTVGPPLPPDAPRMYLVRDVLELVGVELAR